MIQKLLITFCIALYAIGVPILEINDTHVFNPHWPPHVKIHEVWQLVTNSALGALSLWLIWRKNQIMLAAIISSLITGGFLLAFSIRGQYGGSMKYLDGSEKTIFDVNIGVVGFGLAFLLLALAVVIENRAKKVLHS